MASSQALQALLELLQILRPGLTAPGFANLVVVFSGWVLTPGTHAITQALVMTGVSGVIHHERFHRFFSRGTWDPDELGRLLFVRLLAQLSAIIHVVIDDTLAEKKGLHVFGLGTHLNAVRSTKRHKVFTFGHVWVVLAVLVKVPFSDRTWALPILFRLYRTKKECKKHKAPYFKKTELARQMLAVFCSWTGKRKVTVAADSAYCNRTVLRDQPTHLVFFGALRPDAVLTWPLRPCKNCERAKHERCAQHRKIGRPRTRGKAAPSPERFAARSEYAWESCTLWLYGQRRAVTYKTMVAQWYRGAGAQTLRIVVVRCHSGSVPYRVYFSTDASLSAEQVLLGYSERWGIEVCFRELKQVLGFADSSARKEAAVLRTAPFVGLTYTVLVLWFLEGASSLGMETMPVRPWYRHKRGLCFNDVLRSAQVVLAQHAVLDLGRDHDNLRRLRPKRRRHPGAASKRAA
jgi:hypothetical protein